MLASCSSSRPAASRRSTPRRRGRRGRVRGLRRPGELPELGAVRRGRGARSSRSAPSRCPTTGASAGSASTLPSWSRGGSTCDHHGSGRRSGGGGGGRDRPRTRLRDRRSPRPPHVPGAACGRPAAPRGRWAAWRRCSPQRAGQRSVWTSAAARVSSRSRPRSSASHRSSSTRGRGARREAAQRPPQRRRAGAEVTTFARSRFPLRSIVTANLTAALLVRMAGSVWKGAPRTRACGSVIASGAYLAG